MYRYQVGDPRGAGDLQEMGDFTDSFLAKAVASSRTYRNTER